MRGEIWLVRHGETEWSKSGRHTGRTDLPLTEEGKAKAEALRRILPPKGFHLVLASPLARARETCRLAGYEPEVIADLREWDYGEYEGLTTPEIQRMVPGWTVWSSAIPGGESAEEVGVRADRVIERIAAAAGDIAIFGHGHMLRILAARWIGLEARGGRMLALSTGSVSVLGHERETRVIRLWNQTS